MLLVLDREAPDVPAGAVLHVEPAEHERGVADVEVGEPALGDVPGDVALEAGLVGAARADVGVGRPDPLGGGSHRLQPGVRGVDVRLLGRELEFGGPDPIGVAPAPSRPRLPWSECSDAVLGERVLTDLGDRPA